MTETGIDHCAQVMQLEGGLCRVKDLELRMAGKEVEELEGRDKVRLKDVSG